MKKEFTRLRLDKFLADMGIGKRSELKKAIKSGIVKVDGKPVKDPGTIVTPDNEIMYGGRVIVYEQYVYYMMNKPAGVISATEDPRQETVLDLLGPEQRKGIFPCGRLDKDTEGLLLLTNDGDLAHRLLSPKHHVDKVYYAEIDGEVTEDDIELFKNGLVVDDELTAMPAELVILESGKTSKIELTIREGKFHQVKRMFQAVGKEVTYLKRLSMGPLVLDEDLEPGEYRVLTEDELEALMSV